MAITASSFFSGFISLFFLFCLHLSFCCSSRGPTEEYADRQDPPRSKRRKISPSSPSLVASDIKTNHKTVLLSVSSIGSLLKSFFSFHRPDEAARTQQHSSTPPPGYSQSPLRPLPMSPDDVRSPSVSDATATKQHMSFSTRTDIFPCSVCGEVLTKPHLLDLHQAMRHSLSELSDGDSGKNIVTIIFRSGWRGKSAPTVHRVLKIHNSQRTLARFEEYRNVVRLRAAKRKGGGVDERCIADGNERLRFYCSTTLCSFSGAGGMCGSSYCCTCGIVRHGFAGKQADLDGIATHASSWGAHVSLPEDLEREFAFLHVRRAMVVCRVVAGRVARGGAEELEEGVEKGAAGSYGYDSVVPVGPGRRGGARSPNWRAKGEEEDEEGELLVFNPRAVLPCFVIIYTA
ncbi:uncharacterized protein [Typha latifolia]|uniref:uncharacterized protein n=1 Tax=Typha latifolia TaxID=4733 RepID=UPI003C2D0482